MYIDRDELVEMAFMNFPLKGHQGYQHRFSGHEHRYTEDAKLFVLDRAYDDGVRCAARTYGIERRTIQRWAKQYGVIFPRCPDWVYRWKSVEIALAASPEALTRLFHGLLTGPSRLKKHRIDRWGIPPPLFSRFPRFAALNS